MLSNHPKTPAQSPAHATIRRMETGSRKARHEALHLSGVGLVALGLPPSKQMTRVRFPHSAPSYFCRLASRRCGALLRRERLVRFQRRQPIRPLMRQVSQPSCLLGESGSLPLVVANQCPVSSDVKSVGPTNRMSQALNPHWAPFRSVRRGRTPARP